LKKRTKKLLKLKGCRGQNKQKFFGSFFQKRTFFLCFIAASAHAAPAPIILAMRAHDWPLAQSLAGPDPIAQKLVTLGRLLTPDAATAAEIGIFLAANPAWPDQADLRHRLADAVTNDPDQATSLADCEKYKPSLDTALLRCADAERRAGHTAVARDLAQRAWITGVRDPQAEAAFLSNWPDAVPPDVQWRRFDILDWANDPAAGRQVARLDAAHHAQAVTRQAFQHRDPAALDALAGVPVAQRADPVLLFEQARWLRATDANAAALALWRAAAANAEPHAPPDRRAAFWTERDRLARATLATGDADGAYFLADDPNTGPDQAPDALFLAGWIALQRLHDTPRALAKFQALQAVSHSLITQGRAWYWLGRASAGDAARQAYLHAAAYPTTYYGQLAITQTSGAAAIPTAIQQVADPAIPPDQAKAFADTELVRAATLLAGWGDPHWARQFLLRQSQAASDAASFALAARAAGALGLSDVSVQTARFAGRQGIPLPRLGWPAPFDPPATPGVEPALILGLMRQESSFDPDIISAAGAIGLMQLMPATARQIAGRGQDTPDLKNPDENMHLGITYFAGLLRQFNGTRPYAIAAYNAGPHRARAWIAANGDASAAGLDAMIDWIEQIPFAETRNYVQRVLENTAIYAARGAK
jgi:soluble lytic murein transglycosylase